MVLRWAYLLLAVAFSFAAPPFSPCPNILSYDANQPENDRWYGTIHLSTDQPLVGVIIDIRLDRPAEILVSWMGTVSTEDNQRFTILKLNQTLHPESPINSRLMVRFNRLKGVPEVQTIRLNGRQICPPETNSQQNSYSYDSRYTTERVTRRPDLDFSDNSRPVNPTRTDSSSQTRYPKPSSGHSGEVGYSNHETHGQENNGIGAHNSYDTGRHTSHSDSGYNSQYGGSHNSHGSRDPTYDSQESHNNNKVHKPLAVVNSQTNYTKHSNEEPSRGSASNPSINIHINKEVTYSVDTQDMTYNGNNDRETNSGHKGNSVFPAKGGEHSSSGGGGGYNKVTTTTKPAVINSIHISISNGDGDNSAETSTESSSKTTKKPHINDNRNTAMNNRATTQRTPPTRPSATNSYSGYQNGRPNRNPDSASTENYYHSSNEQSSNRRTTEKYNQYNSKGSSDNKPQNTRYTEDSYPSAIPVNRPSGGGVLGGVRPEKTSGSKYGEQGDLESGSSNIKCGVAEVNPAPLITHGQGTSRGQWPWHIALYRIEGINLSYSCGGSLISATVVITAAHCVTKAPNDRPLDADILVVQLGKYHLYQFSDDAVQNKQVKQVIVHPSYNSTNYLDDIALLKLSSPAEFTKYVRPVCLWPRNNYNFPSSNNGEGTVVGWGYDENNHVTEELKMAQMPVVSYVTCLKSYPQFFSQFTSENKTFCAGFRQGTSVCNGDSGGGMVFKMDNVWYLRGLVSITVAKQGLRVCDTSHYVVFTDVANYLNWIHQHTS